MKLVVQRVKKAKVLTVSDNKTIGEIGKGLFEQLMNSPDPEKYGEHDFESIKDQNEEKPIEK